MKLIRRLVVVLSFLFALEGNLCEGVFSLSTRRSVNRNISNNNKNSLGGKGLNAVSVIPRGGGVDKVLVTKCASIFTLLYGAMASSNPVKLVKDAYGVNVADQDDIVPFLIRESGMTMLFGPLYVWAASLFGTSIQKAVGVSVVPWVVRSLVNICSQRSQTLDYPLALDLINLSVFSVVSYTTLLGSTAAANANMAILGLGMYGMAIGASLFLNPSFFIGERTYKDETLVSFILRNHGNNVFCLAVVYAALGRGASISKAYGYCWMAASIGIAIMTFVTNDLVQNNVPMGAALFWIILMTSVGGFLSF